MTPGKWLRTKVFRSVDPAKVRAVETASEEVSREARRLRRRVEEPESAELLRAVLASARRANGIGHT
jgi:hypothetical protein